MKHYTDITILLDRSGSMDKIKSGMEEAFDAFIKGHRVNPSTRISLIQFDTTNDQETIYLDTPVKDVGKLHLNPRGGTPLLDAFAKAIDSTGARLAAKPRPDRPDQVLFVVITDGEENASKATKRSDIEARVRTQTNHFNWAFLYLGANQDAIREAASLGIRPDWTINYAHTIHGASAAMDSMLSNTVAYATNSDTSRGRTKSLSFTGDQRKEAESTKP